MIFLYLFDFDLFNASTDTNNHSADECIGIALVKRLSIDARSFGKVFL